MQAHLLSVFDNVKSVTFHDKDRDRILKIHSQEGETVEVSSQRFSPLPALQEKGHVVLQSLKRLQCLEGSVANPRCMLSVFSTHVTVCTNSSCLVPTSWTSSLSALAGSERTPWSLSVLDHGGAHACICFGTDFFSWTNQSEQRTMLRTGWVAYCGWYASQCMLWYAMQQLPSASLTLISWIFFSPIRLK